MSLGLALIIPDCHFPFANIKAYDLMIRAALEMPIDEIVILGDYADFYSVTSHRKDPSVFNMLKDEVNTVNDRLDDLDFLFPKANKVFIEGNHEYRLERYLLDHAPALFGVTETKTLLNINRRPRWKFVPYGPNQMHSVLHSYLIARHEPLGPNARSSVGRAMCNIVHGHTHRAEMAYAIGLKGEQYVCYSPGWLGDVRQDKIFGYTVNKAQWTTGFGLVHVDTKTRLFYSQNINIVEYKKKLSCVINGQVFYEE
jgi:UDP-2,3-diacylglucosamine pyrophosphatase LpxH